MIKTLIAALTLLLACAGALAAGPAMTPERAPRSSHDLPALQNGAKLFINYCLSCHSAQAVRYNTLQELGLSEQQIRDNLLFTGESTSDPMRIAMTPEEARKWFGIAPPDLSVIARAKSTSGGASGSDYLYTYLRSFYRDSSTLTGWNNLLAPGTAMPHALWERQGPRELKRVFVRETPGPGGDIRWEKVTTLYDVQGYAMSTASSVTPKEGQAVMPEAVFKALDPARAAAYDRDIADLTAFMTWMAEPVRHFRIQLGIGVMIFLGLFLLVAWRLNAAYWKHVR